MNRLDRVQRISGLLRYLLLFVSAVLFCAIAMAVFTSGSSLVTLGDGQLNDLHGSGAIGSGLMFALAAPFFLALGLGIYWLQRLFGEYQKGCFFSDNTMRCYIWLVWLKAAVFVYGILWPVIFSQFSHTQAGEDVHIHIELGTVVELVVLLLIVHLLKAAQHLHDENKAFI